MPLRSNPTFTAVPEKTLVIEQPGVGGINLKDLEYEQQVSQTPYMLNMMYKNGAFGKRYGQSVLPTIGTYSDEVYAIAEYKNALIVHAGTYIYKDGTQIASGISAKKGLFVLFNQLIYYFCTNIYSYDGKTWSTVTLYVPTIVINRHPDGSSGDVSEPYNMIGTGFQNNFHGDGSSTVYYLTDKNLDQEEPSVTVDGTPYTYDPDLSSLTTFKVDYTDGKITFHTAPLSGTNNVEIIAYKHDNEWTSYHDQIVSSKYYSCFGGNNNSRLFLAGGGKSTYYYSEVYDASYFPYTNYARLGNGAEDITGFGQQYNVLIVFKPTEIYSLQYYQQSSGTTEDESQFGLGAFTSQVVNSSIGCDCPNTIQLIDNQLTWFSSTEGVCTLVSTSIVDERNIRSISRNINRTNNMGVRGILDHPLYYNGKSIKESVVSIDYDNKYFLCFPYEYVDGVKTDCGMCYVWDYGISPFSTSVFHATEAKNLSWFLFDHFFVNQFLKYGKELIYSETLSTFNRKLIQLNDTFYDPDFDGDSSPDAIEAYFMTPFLQFGAVEALKNVKNIYVQTRGDTATVIDMYYYTNESINPEAEPESIRIGGKLWKHFQWGNFQWLMVNWANTIRRKCNLKKIQMASFFFCNNDAGRDMSITHIALQYQIIKYIR